MKRSRSLLLALVISALLTITFSDRLDAQTHNQ